MEDILAHVNEEAARVWNVKHEYASQACQFKATHYGSILRAYGCALQSFFFTDKSSPCLS